MIKISYFNSECEKISKSCDLEFGKNQLPLTALNNLLCNNAELNKNGFGKFPVLSKSTFASLKKCIEQIIIQQLSAYQKISPDFELSQYHNFLESEENHYKISTWALEYKEIGDVFFEIKKDVEDLLGLKLKVKTINHRDKEGEYIGFRIIRPMKNDHNPFHRDAWIPYWRDTVNVWLPLCGFEDGNSLQIIPKSHQWRDDQILKTKAGVEIEGKKYHVSAAIGAVNEFTIETPLLNYGEGLVFSPYLIHGNGVNRKDNTTRVSLEFRFCRE